MLVEPRLYRPSMREKTLTRLDEDIEKTLNSNLDDVEKAQLYIETLRRYKHFDTSVASKEEEKENTETDILESVPVEQRHRAKRLLEHLKQDSSIKIGDKGEFMYNQQKLHQSHVGDLLNDILRKKSTATPPQGWREFSDSLKYLEVPRDLVENTDRWKFMHPPERKTSDDLVSRQKKYALSLEKNKKKSLPSPKLSAINRASRLVKRVNIRNRWLDYDDDNQGF